MRQHWRRCLGLPWHQPRHGAGAESSTPGSLPPHTTLQPPSPCHCQQQQGNLEQGRPCRAQPSATARRRAGHPLGSLRRAAASPQPFPRGLGTGRSSRLKYLLSDCSKATSSRCLDPNVSTQWVLESPATGRPEWGHPDRATTARSCRARLLPRGAVGLCRGSGASKGTRAAARAARHGADGASTRARAAGAITSCALG